MSSHISAAHTSTDSESCSICLDPTGTNGGVSKTQCGHHFCTCCISLSLAVEDRCPLCRRDHPDPAAEVSGSSAPCHSISAAPASSHQLEAREEDPCPAHIASNIPDSTSGSSAVGELFALNHLVNSIETIVGCIASVDHQSPAWNAQLSELQDMHMHLATELLGGVAQISQVWQLKDHIETYTASVAADFAEFVMERDTQQQQQQSSHGDLDLCLALFAADMEGLSI